MGEILKMRFKSYGYHDCIMADDAKLPIFFTDGCSPYLTFTTTKIQLINGDTVTLGLTETVLEHVPVDSSSNITTV